MTLAVTRLSGKQKCAIATKEVVFAQHEYGQVRLTNRIQLEKVRADLNLENIFLQSEKYFQARAATEEREMRLGDVHKTLAEFQRDIVGGAVHPRTGVYMAEKVTQSQSQMWNIFLRTMELFLQYSYFHVKIWFYLSYPEVHSLLLHL